MFNKGKTPVSVRNNVALNSADGNTSPGIAVTIWRAPNCGRAATARWVERELGKLVDAPYFLVTLTLPEQLRGCFFGPHAQELYALFFASAAPALSEKLASAKSFRAHLSGFTAVLHTWNQRLEFHPHLDVLVPGAGMDAYGKVVRVKKADYLLHLPFLQVAFRQQFKSLLDARDWEVDPAVWTRNWGIHIQPCGSGRAALKYLGAYVARSAISDGRILSVDAENVTFKWKDRSDGNRVKPLTLSGVEFVRRYLRHVLPRGLRSIRASVIRRRFATGSGFACTPECPCASVRNWKQARRLEANHRIAFPCRLWCKARPRSNRTPCPADILVAPPLPAANTSAIGTPLSELLS